MYPRGVFPMFSPLFSHARAFGRGIFFFFSPSLYCRHLEHQFLLLFARTTRKEDFLAGFLIFFLDSLDFLGWIQNPRRPNNLRTRPFNFRFSGPHPVDAFIFPRYDYLLYSLFASLLALEFPSRHPLVPPLLSSLFFFFSSEWQVSLPRLTLEKTVSFNFFFFPCLLSRQCLSAGCSRLFDFVPPHPHFGKVFLTFFFTREGAFQVE